MKLRVTLFLGVTLLSSSPLIAAQFEGFPINYEVLPIEARALLPVTITTDDFKARLKQGGTIVLTGNETVMGQPIPSQKSLAFLALDALELRKGAKIITNGNTLVIFVNRLVSEDGQIISFPESSKKAPSGNTPPGFSAAGEPGQPGLSGGLVSIHVIQGMEGRLKVNLHGQDGGNGAPGGPGAKGTKGSRGEDAQDGPGGWLTPGWCKSGGGDGGIGGQGFPGGAGGTGGPGGDGGYFELINVGATPLPNASYDFVASGGGPGSNGQGGIGGPGGDGGDGGHGSTWCGGGRGGPQGPTGDPGPTLVQAARTGAPGQAVVKNLDLEIVVRAAVAQAHQ